jgi:hypothetical protein
MQNATLAAIRDLVRPAVARQDVETLRTALVIGATFASFTIRQRTEVAERHFGQWLAAGMPDDVRQAGVGACWQDKNARLASVRALTDAEVLLLFTLEVGQAAAVFASLTWGYALPKASFSLACAGAQGGGACFDTWMLKHFPALVESSGWSKFASLGWKGASLKRRAEMVTAYETLCQAAFGRDHAHGQWEIWLAAYARDCKHTVLFDAMRGAVR